MSLLDRLASAVKRARGDYVEVRAERTWRTTVQFRGRRLENATVSEDSGVAVRVLNRGRGWGIATFTNLEQLPNMLVRAHEMSDAIHVDDPITLAEVPVTNDDVQLDLDGDVRGVSLADKKALLDALNDEMLGVDERIADTQATYQDTVSEYCYLNSEGTQLSELRPEVTLSALATARQGDTIEKGLESLGLRCGWSSVQDRAPMFREAAERAVALLDAPRVTGGAYPVILDPKLAGVFIHEAFGHLSEADFVYENPQAREMMSLGRHFGREILTIGDDGSHQGLRGTLPYDDEGR